jgi:hypothetical protein
MIVLCNGRSVERSWRRGNEPSGREGFADGVHTLEADNLARKEREACELVEVEANTGASAMLQRALDKDGAFVKLRLELWYYAANAASRTVSGGANVVRERLMLKCEESVSHAENTRFLCFGTIDYTLGHVHGTIERAAEKREHIDGDV